MNINTQRIKRMVSKDFDETLRSIIKPLMMEELRSKSDNQEINVTKKQDQKSKNNTSIGLKLKVIKNSDIEKDGPSSTPRKEQGQTKPISPFREPLPINKNQINKIKRQITMLSDLFTPPFNSSKLPFASTTVTSLPFKIVIKIDPDIYKNRLFTMDVNEFFTVDMIKLKISTGTKIDAEQQAIYHKEERLEGYRMLYNCGIKSNSEINMTIAESIKVNGILNQTIIPLIVYSSTTILKIKELFAKELGNVYACHIELRYNEFVLDDSKELFIYHVSDNCKISITILNDGENQAKNRAYQDVNNFFKMTNNLKICKCSELRIQTMSTIIRLMCEDTNQDEEIYKNVAFLNEIDISKNYHHKDCFKLLPSPMKNSTGTLRSLASEVSHFSFSGSDSSFKSAVFTEDKLIDKYTLLEIDPKDIQHIAEAKDFQEFKNILKKKIGTKCSLRSVALLYKYAKVTVRFIGFNEGEANTEVDNILNFTTKYFEKYFKNEIVKKGGMDVFTLAASEVD